MSDSFVGEAALFNNDGLEEAVGILGSDEPEFCAVLSVETGGSGYAHLSPSHLKEAVSKASLSQPGAKTGNETVTATVTKENQPITRQKEETAEALDELAEVGGGAERVRTAASQFCRTGPSQDDHW